MEADSLNFATFENYTVLAIGYLLITLPISWLTRRWNGRCIMQIKIRDLHKSYQGMKALDGLNLDIDDVRSLAIFGPSGGGKTTLLRVLGGWRSLTAGRSSSMASDAL
jgi:ABC-type polysaccharide/polyol phosphate transport system ATPase subunit